MHKPGPIISQDGTTFTVWALDHDAVSVEVDRQGRLSLDPVGEGYFRGFMPGAGHGDRYGFRVDGGALLPDLCSRFQPDGSEGLSMLWGSDFVWTDGDWRGTDRFDQVVYELHVGTFTPKGTWAGAMQRLDHLRELGITAIHLMPFAVFKGRFGWGYDTVLPYAPFAPYGTPDDLRRFVDTAHGLGIGVVHDVVYNHVGIGDHYRHYSDHYFSEKYKNEWGAGFNFDGEHNRAVRDFIVGNAAYWIEDFHFDGLRLDATQALFDDGDDHIIAEIARTARAAAHGRDIFLLAENHTQDRRLILPQPKGYGLDAIVSDDFQHAARVAATGRNDFYYRDYLGTPQELVSALKHGFLYQGQRSDMREKPYGTYNLDMPADRFVHFLENHDQVANSARGFRLHDLASPARIRALTALLLLGPQTPCLFQGQEWGATNPFLYFLGLEGDEAIAVAKGRHEQLGHFLGLHDSEMRARLPDPAADETLAISTLDWDTRNAATLKLHRDLLKIRRTDKAFSQKAQRRVDGAVIGEAALILRYITDDPTDHRLLLVNFGHDLPMGVIAEPLLAPPLVCRWMRHWSSEHGDYDGAGRYPYDFDSFNMLSADTALLLKPEPRP